MGRLVTPCCQYTSIIHTHNGVVQTVRAHNGHMDAVDRQCYMDGCTLKPGDQVRFDHIDLYSDIGDTVGSWTRS
jgi:hypothetical protein